MSVLLYKQYFDVAIFLHDKKLAELIASYFAIKENYPTYSWLICTQKN